jgi:hypothetical protein
MTQDTMGAFREEITETNSRLDEKQSVEELNPGERERERARILRKLDMRLLPLVTLLYLLSFL